MTAKIRTIFMGTPEFAVPGLQALLKSPDFEIVGVYTQPDKPVGRKMILTPPPIKTAALTKGLPIFQPEKINAEADNIRSLKPDLIVVIAYGKIIPQTILDIPQYGCVNVHASLLPKYRGASCLAAPILNGDEESGVTIMKMDAGMDTGDIIKQAGVKLSAKETLSSLHDRLSALGAEILADTLKEYINGTINPQKQDESQASYVPLIKKEDGRLQVNLSAAELERRIRAYNPWPGAFLLLNNGEKIKVLEADTEISANTRKIGEIYTKNGQLALNCGQDILFILKLQRENRKAMNASDFLKGNQDILNLNAI
ncbi:MAG: methionyl-tRNA formyltransferase [Patescibacteria group bacterium]|nr:methionyl-tRNA formyltransferase [Patescibacteria group bacterium]